MKFYQRAVQAVIEQEKPAVTQYGACRYRAPDGSKCAVGHLINDEHYNKDLERCCVYTVTVLKAVEASIGRHLSPDEQDILDAIQNCHDGNVDSKCFVEDFKNSIQESIRIGLLPEDTL